MLPLVGVLRETIVTQLPVRAEEPQRRLLTSEVFIAAPLALVGGVLNDFFYVHCT